MSVFKRIYSSSSDNSLESIEAELNNVLSELHIDAGKKIFVLKDFMECYRSVFATSSMLKYTDIKGEVRLFFNGSEYIVCRFQPMTDRYCSLYEEVFRSINNKDQNKLRTLKGDAFSGGDNSQDLVVLRDIRTFLSNYNKTYSITFKRLNNDDFAMKLIQYPHWIKSIRLGILFPIKKSYPLSNNYIWAF